MKTKLLFLFVLLISIRVSSQNVQQGQSKLNLRFFDEATGCVVIPNNVEIKQRENSKISCNFSNKQIASNGTVLIPLANGIYDITVFASSYKPMTTYFDLNNQTLNVNFNLVPIVPIKELSSEYIQSLHQADAMVIVGFIVDDATGMPLDKVVIYSADKIANSLTKKNGFFQLILPLAENENAVENRGTLYFKKNNYTTEVRQKFDMWPSGDVILQIRMKKGVGLNKENIIQNRDVNRLLLDKTSQPIKKH